MKAGKLTYSVSVLLWALLLLSACASEVGDIDRTDPDKVRKADLKGVWYFQMTVIEAPVPSPVTFNGEQNFGGGSSVVFDIQQDYLIAYPVSELYVVNSEADWRKASIRNYWDKGRSDEFMEMYVGSPVAAFKISSHFDVMREYNTSTGDQSNVISENTTDRKWFEREYIRVDWSQNYVKDLMFLAGVKGSAVDYYVQEYEEDNPDRFHLSESGLHFVNKLYLEPVSPSACSIYDVANYDCAGAVVKVRYAFTKADPNNDYVPLFYDNDTYEDRYGFFMTTRAGFDPDYGIIYGNKRYLVNRWNIWETSRDAVAIMSDGQNVSCYEDKDCEPYALINGKENQVHCWVDDGWWSQGHCVTWNPTQFDQRKPKPIIYHASPNWPKEVWDSLYRTADVWSVPFKETVAWLQTYAEFGMYDINYCESDADCASDDIVADIDLLQKHARKCTADADCKVTGAVTRCRADGICVSNITCDATNPCDLGQLCSQGVCKAAASGVTNPDPANANDWVRIEPEVADAGAYTVYYLNGAEGPEFKTSIDDPLTYVDAQTAAINFVHLNPYVGDVILQDENGTICQNNDGSDKFYAYMGGNSPFFTSTCVLPLGAASKTLSFKAVELATGTTLAVYNYVVVGQQEVHTFILTGDASKTLLVHGSLTQTEFNRRGVRLAHAAPGKGAVDFGMNGGLRFRNVAYGDVTLYSGMTQEDNRMVLTEAGTNGDVTCFRNNGIGMCLGWRTPNDDAVMARYKEIYDSLPPMFIACENVYTGDKCTDAQRGDMTQLNDCRYWYQDGEEWRNPCGEIEGAGNAKLHGDTRYNVMFWVPESQYASPLGYGPSSADPETGEIFYGVANIYGADMVMYGQYASDLLDASRGALSKEQLSSASYVKEFVDAKKSAEQNETLYAPLSISQKEFNRRSALRPQVKRFWMNPEEERQNAMLKKDVGLMRSVTHPNEFWETVRAAMPATMSADQQAARFKKVQGTWIEGLLLSNEVQNAIRLADGTAEGALTQDQLSSASPLNWASPSSLSRWQERHTRLAEATYYEQELVEPFLYATAVKVQEYCQDENNRKEFNWTEEQCRHWTITKWMLYGTLEHEVGHTIGLRHNFIASTDVFNYQDEYFEKRELDYRRCFIVGPDGCAFRDYCEMFCESDTDCMPGTTCTEVDADGQTVKACVDQHMKPTGWCWGTRTERTECTTATDCAALGEKVRCDKTAEQTFGYCAAAVKAENGVCAPGTLNGADNYCVKDDQCDTAKGKCVLDGGKACASDEDCQLVYAVVETESDYGPVKGYVPRSEITQTEIENGRQEFQYSSLMDYGGTINFDLQDIGKYDAQAIRFGYGELVDVYTNVSNLDRAINDVASYYGYSDPIYVSFYRDTEFFTQTWFNQFLFLNDFIGLRENLERRPAPFRKVLLERTALDSYDRGAADFSYYMIPHKYRGDEWRGNLETYVFDIGTDMQEIVAHSWSKLHEYYVFDAFKRERFAAYKGANPMGYYNRILDRWLGPMADTGRYFSMFYNVFRPWPSYRMQFEGDVMRLGGWREVAEDAMTKMVQLLTSPAPGSYVLKDAGTEYERYVNVAYEMGQNGSQLDVPIGEGKFPFTTYWQDAGYYYFDHAAFIGSFWEKVASLYSLTYSLGYFVGDYLGEQVDVGVGTSIGFNTNFYTELTNVLAGMVVGNTDFYAPFVDADNKLRFVRPTSQWEGMGMTRVETSIENLTLKAYIALFAYAYLPAGFDNSFTESMFLCLKGNGSCYDIAEHDDFANPDFGVEVVEFVDPWSKKTYVAKSADYDPDRIQATYWLVTQANDKLTEWEDLDGDETEDGIARREQLGKELRETVDLLDMIYTFNEMYGLLHY